jgi:hypothetical protein
MPKLASFDSQALDELARKQHGVISREQALACAMSAKAVQYRIRPGGPWQVALPGIYAIQTGALTETQRATAAFLHAGHAIAVTGRAAIAHHGIPCKRSELVDVLVPLSCRRQDVGFARLHRTSTNVQAVRVGEISYAVAARAVADTVRQLTDMAEVRALVAASVQREKATVWQLQEELSIGPQRGSARLRGALAEVAEGIRSSAEGDLRTLTKKSGLPEALFNPTLLFGSEFLACPDAWWPQFGVAAEVDSKAWHLSPEDWEQTLARHARMTAQGILVLHFPPNRIRSEGWKVAQEIRSAIKRSRGPLPHITTVPA